MKPVHPRQENWLVPIGRVQDQRAVYPVRFLGLPTLRVLQHWGKGTTFVSNMVDLPSFSDKVGKPTDPSLKGKKSYWGEGVQGQDFWQWPPIVCCPWPWVDMIFTLREILRLLNTVLAVCEYMSFGKLWQEKGCSSQAETWQVKNIYTDERFWLTGKICHFRRFHGNMNDWIQP